MTWIPLPKGKCKHCKGDLSIRNPKGFCDHLYYPDYCEICKNKVMEKQDKKLIKVLKQLGFVTWNDIEEKKINGKIYWRNKNLKLK
jgi:hypothetical protein